MSITESRPAVLGTPDAARWIRRFHPKEAAVARLVCFPHAGGAANAFHTLSGALPDDVELLAVQYPGRQERRAEPAAGSVEALAEGVAAALAAYADRPLFLLGHSMGALVAFETARRSEAARLFVSAAQPPAPDWGERDLDDCDDAEIVAVLRELGGVPEPLLADEESLREVLRLLRADHRLLRRYHCPADAVVPAPVTALLAVTDPKNSLGHARGWARHTAGGHRVERLPGGHFSLLERVSVTTSLLVHQIREDVAAESEPPGTPADLVREIYLAGAAGRTPPLPTDLTTLERLAADELTPVAYGYLAGNAGAGATARANREAFGRRQLVPRMLRDVGRRDLAVSLYGRRLAAPVLLAPVAAQTVAHPDGELATARAAADVGLPFVLSSFASTSLEDVAAAAGPAPRWFQLYWPSDRAVAASLVRRAEESGYTALVVTVDAPVFGYRPAELDHGFVPFLHGTGLANFTSDPAFRAVLPPGADGGAIVAHWAQISGNPGLDWAELPWLRERTTLPILLKGILHPADARRALESGVDGVVVSNHGGRQLDGSVAALDALPGIRAAVGAAFPVLLDSGIRTGTDVLKALALGADAVLYGRPYAYGLGLAGQRGVEHVLRCLLAELDLALALTGCRSIGEVTTELLAPPAAG